MVGDLTDTRGHESSFIGVVVSTFNRPNALAAVLDSLVDQVYRPFEVIVADDGSGPDTAELVESLRDSVPYELRHVWHEDRGYRLAAIRNRATAATSARYVVHTDGDCLVRPDFLARHARLAERGFFVRGSRIHLGRSLTERVLDERLAVHRWGMGRWLPQRTTRQLDRISPLLRLPLGPLRKARPRKWDGVKACNLGIWRDDFLAVNGFDEAYEGWGREDNDLVLRLTRIGVRRKEGRYAVPVLHLWHETREPEALNYRRFEERLRSDATWIERGVSQYL